MTVPPWLERHLVDTGAWDADAVTRRMQTRKCPKCGRRVFTGLDSELCAASVRADTDTITPAGEVAALIDKRRTFNVTAYGAKHFELDFRDSLRLKTQPADSVPVVAEHRCGSVLGGGGVPIARPVRLSRPEPSTSEPQF